MTEPIVVAGWVTTVSAGETSVAHSESSNPTTATSSGTLRPACAIAPSRRPVSTLLWAKMAVGRGRSRP